MKLLCSLLLLLLVVGCAPLTPAPQGEKIVRNLAYKTASGRTLRMDLYLPRGAGPHPLVLWMHGGGWKYGDKGWMLYLRKLTADGFAVASVEYRLSGRAKYPAQYEDCRDAFLWMKGHAAQYGIDSRNLFVAGASAGAHLAALLGEREGRANVNAECLMYPPTDLTGFENQDRLRGYLPELLGGSVNQKRALAREASPITDVSAQSPPTLIFHGAKDTLVPIAQSKLLEARLHARGVECHLVVEPDKAHSFPLTDPEIAQVAKFFKAHLRKNDR